MAEDEKLEGTPEEEVKAEEEKVEEAPAEKISHGPKSKKEKKALAKAKKEAEEEVKAEEEEAEEEEAEEEKMSHKDEVEAKIRKQIEKKQEKRESLGIYRISEYLKEEHQWENWLFLFVSIVTLVIGGLMLSGALIVKESFPIVGSYPTAFAWTLVGISSLGLLYALYPFFKPAIPELKKITWLSVPKFIGNSIRTFVFIILLTLLFLLYDSFITEILKLIM